MAQNPLQSWFDNHFERVLTIVEGENLLLEQIPDFFLYSNMRQKHPNFCPLYETHELCHPDIDEKRFCCLFCACPLFDSELWKNLDGKYLFGNCKFEHGRGGRLVSGFWDCTHCSFVHDIDWVRKNFKRYVHVFSQRSTSTDDENC